MWKARDSRLNRTVAVKRLKGQYNARFEQEARAIAALNHPHICQIFESGPTTWCSNTSTGNPAQGGPVGTPTTPCALAMQIAEALESRASSKGVVHRDLKPANNMVTSEEGL